MNLADWLVTWSILVGGWTCFSYLAARHKYSDQPNPVMANYNPAKLYNPKDYDCANCTWNTYTLNADFPYKHRNHYIYDDELVFIDTPEQVCIPESFGYDDLEAARLFPYTGFPPCGEGESGKIRHYSNQLEMNCTNAYYVPGIIPTEDRLGDVPFEQEIVQYRGQSIDLGSREFVFATCEGRVSQFEFASLRPQPLKHLLSAAPVPVPTIILCLTLDSVSRRNFFRKLPKTLGVLNSLSIEDYSVFDFKIHNVVGEYSASNILPMLFGDVSFKRLKSRVKGELFYDSSVYRYAQEAGWATLLIEESCENDLAAYIGEKPQVDHLVSHFWCGAKRFYGFKNNSKNQRCIAQHNSHVYAYKYADEFASLYSHLNQWQFVFVNTAHENTGTVIETLDQDTADFLADFLEKHRDKEVMLMLTGDHGMRYGEWFKTIDGSHEHRLPLGMVIASRSLLEKHPYSLDTLTHNTNRLTSKLDLYLTMRHLIDPEGVTRTSAKYNELKAAASSRYKPVSLLLEKVPNNRTCADMGIPVFWCSCLKFLSITFPMTYDFDYLVGLLATEVVFQINEEAYSPKSAKQHICQKLTFNEVKQLWVLSTDEDFFKMTLTVNESDSALFEAVVMITTANYRARSIADAYTLNPFYDYGPKRFRIMYIRRVDSYAGTCELVARRKNIAPDLCICKDIASILAKEPFLASALGS
mmetsp:Transcript_6961/g.12676  ORF Transcript_6961/g.12676 Transcript_6961/m.12676 type:complete len:697 (+) Transcript_6961:23-2113(+)